MAGRFSIDITPALNTQALVAERNRMVAEQDAQKKQALLTLALAAGGAMIPGVPALSGAQGGAAVASLIGPRPNVNAAVNLGIGAAGSYQQAQDAAKRDTLLSQFSQAVNPAMIPMANPNQYDTSQGPNVTPAPDRQAAAAAAAGLGDLKTASALAFPGGESGTPQTFTATVMGDNGKPEVTLFDKASGKPIRTLGEAQGRTTTNGNMVQEIYDPDKNITQRILFDKQGNQLKVLGQVRPPKESGGGGGTGLKGFELVNFNDLHRQAISEVVNMTGRTDILDAAANGATIQELAKIGQVPEWRVQQAYKDQLVREINGPKPKSQKDLARAELKKVNAWIDRHNTNIKLARSAWKAVKTQDQKDKFMQMLENSGIDFSELKVGPPDITLAK